jgi:hypothetical protein
MELSFEEWHVMVYDHCRPREIFHAGTDIAEQEGCVTGETGYSDLLPDPYPELDTRSEHRVTEDRGGGYAVCIMVGNHLDILLPPYLGCDGFRCGFKRH